MLERFFEAKSFGLHISKPKNIPGNIFFDILKVRKSSRRGLLGRQKCILSQKGVPQGPFLRIKMYFELEKASRRGLLGKIFDKLRIQGRMQFFEKKVPEGFKSRFDRLER